MILAPPPPENPQSCPRPTEMILELKKKDVQSFLRSGSELLARAYCGYRDPFLLGCWPQRWPEHDPGLLKPYCP